MRERSDLTQESDASYDVRWSRTDRGDVTRRSTSPSSLRHGVPLEPLSWGEGASSDASPEIRQLAAPDGQHKPRVYRPNAAGRSIWKQEISRAGAYVLVTDPATGRHQEEFVDVNDPLAVVSALRRAFDGRLGLGDAPTTPPADDPYGPLRAMVGMIEDGPTDSSSRHDGRPGDPA